MEAVILAGGLGSRLRPVVPDLPKPMAPVDGRPFLERLLDYWIGQGIRRFVLSVGYKHDVIQAHFGGTYRGAPLAYAVEEAPLGTGGGLLRAMQALNAADSFVVLNGDTFFEVDLDHLRRFHVQSDSELTISLRTIADNSRYTGIELDEHARVVSFYSRGAAVASSLINGGVYLVEPDIFSGFPADSGNPVSLEDELFPWLLSRHRRLCGFVSSGRFIDIGIPEDYRRVGAVLGSA